MLNLLLEGLVMHKKLLIPGPTEVSQEILNEQTHPMIGHRDKEFSDLYAGITAKIAGTLSCRQMSSRPSQHLQGLFGLTLWVEALFRRKPWRV